MKIQRVNELNENFEDNIHDENDKIQKLKNILMESWDHGFAEGGYNERDERYDDFDEWWNSEGDKLILEFLKEEPKKHGNTRQILPQMVQKSNNSKITQATAQTIADKFTPSELNDFKRWLQLIK